MKNLIFALLALIGFLVITGFWGGDDLDRIIPDSATQGAVEITNASFGAENKLSGLYIECDGVVPFDAKPQAVRAGILKILKGTKQLHPEAHWIVVRLYPDKRLLNTEVQVGAGQLKDSVATVSKINPTNFTKKEFQKAVECRIASRRIREASPNLSDRQVDKLVARKCRVKDADVENLWMKLYLTYNPKSFQ